MVLRLGILFMFGCGADEQQRVVSEESYPEEYAEAMCSLQVECELRDDLESCKTETATRWVDKLDQGCFDEAAARECLDSLESIDCEGFGNNEADHCTDVDECS